MSQQQQETVNDMEANEVVIVNESDEENFASDEDNEEINEDEIYKQMYQAISGELQVSKGCPTPNLDSLALSSEDILAIRGGGLAIFKDIMSARFRESIEREGEEESNQNESNSFARGKGDEYNDQSENIEMERSNIDQQREDEQYKMVVKETEASVTVEVTSDPHQASEQYMNITNRYNNGNVYSSMEESIISDKGISLSNSSSVLGTQQEILSARTNVEGQSDAVAITQTNKLSRVSSSTSAVNSIAVRSTTKTIENNQAPNSQFASTINMKPSTIPSKLSQETSKLSKSVSQRTANNAPSTNSQVRLEGQSDDKITQQIPPTKVSAFSIKKIPVSNSPTQLNPASQPKLKKVAVVDKRVAFKLKKQGAYQSSTPSLQTDVFSLSGIKVSQFKDVQGNNRHSQSNDLWKTEDNFASNIQQSSIYQEQQNLSFQENHPRSKHDEYVDDIYRRQREVEEKIGRKIEEKIQQELDQSKNIKHICPGSEQIVAKSVPLKPLVDRASDLVKIAEQKRQQQIESKLKSEEDRERQECTFHPQILPASVEYAEGRTFEKFLDAQKDFHKNRDLEIQAYQASVAEKEMAGTTFQPKINKISSQSIRTIKIEDQLIAYQEKVIDKKKRIAEESVPLFKPIILPKSQQLVQKKKKDQMQQQSEQLSRQLSSLSLLHDQ